MKQIRLILSVILCFALCIGASAPAMAAGENNSLGVTFGVSLDVPEISVSDVDQVVTMTLTANQGITMDGIGFTVTWDEPLEWTAITGGAEMGAYDSVATNYANGKTAWYSPDSENVSDIRTIAVMTFKVPAGTPAGSYNLGVTSLELTQNYGSIIWENSAYASTVLTITEGAAPTDGYTAGLSALTNAVSVEDSLTVNVNVSHSADSTFAAGEVIVAYDSNLLTFNEASSTLGTATVKVDSGVLTLEDYGADKNLGNGVYMLAFDAIADGETAITLTSAAFVNKENAVRSDLVAATLSSASVNLIIHKQTYSITLPDIFNGPDTVVDGEDYTFSVADGHNYNYTSVNATVDGVSVDVIDNGNGTYTVKNVTGELVISGTRVEKSYSVTFAGNAAAEITDGADTATYNTDYTFTMPSANGWAYSLDGITIAGTVYTGYSVDNSVYTIPGSAITGEIVITVSKNATEASVVVQGSGAGAAAGYETKANIGASYTLTITPEAGYVYTVTATMGGNPAAVTDNGNNTYTIAKVTDNIIFTVERIVIVDGVSVTEYLSLDGTVMWLVKNKTTLTDAKVPTYDGEKMYWSEKYDAYCYLVIAQTLNLDDATSKIDITDGTAVSIDYSMDINATGKVDASDAQLTYNMYNAAYSEFTSDVTMEKFFRADVNADGTINVQDATAIISSILK